MKKYITKFIPWYLMILIKLVLSRLPAKYNSWAKLNLFKHGDMLNIDYAFKIFEKHIGESRLQKLDNITICELGPGDSLATALIAYSFGAKSILIDVGSFASKDLEFYKSLNNYLKIKGLRYLKDFKNISNVSELLVATNSIYLNEGLNSLKNLKKDSIDILFSQAVLEHVLGDEIDDLFTELARVLKKDGISTHQVDLKDHLGGGLNHLRLPSSIWESNIFRNSGFYTNRISLSEYVNIFERNNFDFCIYKNKWNKIPINTISITKELSLRSEDDLIIKDFFVKLILNSK